MTQRQRTRSAVALSTLALAYSASMASCDTAVVLVDAGDAMDDSTSTDSGSEAGLSDAGTDVEAGDPDCVAPNCATAIALGLEHACALAANGSVRCWGLNDFGQLGVGPAGTDGGVPDMKNTPQLVGIGPAKAITAGFHHTCAIVSDNSVWCWGDNSQGQLAQPADGGQQAPNITPQKVVNANSGITRLEAGGWHTCVLLGGWARCWGLNTSGQCGVGTVTDAGVAPAFTIGVGLGADVFDIGVGDEFSCMVRDAGIAGCFGSNLFGQLGRGGDAGAPLYDPNFASTIAQVNNNMFFANSKGSHQCLRGEGGNWCWGRNHQGQVNGLVTAPITVPQTVGINNAAEFAPGGSHTCARIFDAGVKCWGGNPYGQAGQMITEAGVSIPTGVPGLLNAIQVASGADFSCAIVKGTVWCWGANFQGQLGRGSNAPQFTDVPGNVAF